MCKQKIHKLNFEEVLSYFEKHNCKLLETNYLNNKTDMRFVCHCGKEDVKKFYVFKDSPMCRQCSKVNNKSHCTKREKHTIDSVSRFFKDNGCELLENNYVNGTTKMKYKCNCGNISQITFSKFKIGRRCSMCANERKSKTLTQPYSFVVSYYEKFGWKVITSESEYINSTQRIDCICENGHVCKSDFISFKQGFRCNICAGFERHSYEYVQQYFKDRNCELLEDSYLNAHTKMKYRCCCGKIGSINFNNFSSGKRCSNCKSNMSRGEISIAEYLKTNNYQYYYQYIFEDCCYKNPLPFDFATYVNDEIVLIEFDGKQHFEPVEFFGGLESFKQRQIYDQIKNEYCKKHLIKLIRIPYWEIDNVETILDKTLNKTTK